MVAGAVVSFGLTVDIDVDDIETMSGRQKLVEVEEAGSMMAGSTFEVKSAHTQVYLRPVEDMRWMSQLRWKERLRSVGPDSLLLWRLPTRDRQ